MINEKQVKKYCSEDISLIENYQEAVSSPEKWDCHHRGEILPCGRFTMYDLDKFGLYMKRPACELIFMNRLEHRRMHKIGGRISNELKNKLSKRKDSVKVPVLAFFGGVLIGEFDSQKEAARALNLNTGNIHNVLNGERRQTHGYTFRRAS